MSAIIVVIEDEEDILELLEYNLKKEGYDVVGFLSTQNVEKMLADEPVDLMIVDRNLPGVEGSEFVASLRAKGIQVPVIFLSAKGEEHHKIEGFNRGGDDYMTKPFSLQELMARVRAILKRSAAAPELLSHRDIVIDLVRHQVTVDGEEVELTKKEFDLLCELVRNKNSVLDRDVLLERVWGFDEVYQNRTVDVAIKRLKEKIDPLRQKNYIQSVRGIGYKLS
ncbi:MAG: response regulator transcription factor [Campylobacterales bacterium]